MSHSHFSFECHPRRLGPFCFMFAAVLLAAHQPVFADTDRISAAKRDGFVVVPIRTELQRAYRPKYQNATVFVLINAMDAVKDEGETLDVTKLKLPKILDAITPLARKDDPGSVIFWVFLKKDGKAGQIGPCPFWEIGIYPASYYLNCTLQQLGRDAGFEDVDVGQSHLLPHAKYANNWEEAVRDVLTHPSDQNVVESPVGDKQVKLFPVQTGLSRFIYGADLVVYYVPPITDVDVSSVIETMRASITKLQIKEKDKVLFLFNRGSSRELNSLAIDELIMDKRVYKDLLGFNSWSGSARH